MAGMQASRAGRSDGEDGQRANPVFTAWTSLR
jgi:hypothetical protein